MKSVCSEPYPVKLQVFPVAILELALILYEHLLSPITDVNFLHCSLHLFSYPDTVENHLSLSPLPTPIGEQSGLLPFRLPFSRLSNPSPHSLSLSILCSCPAQPVSHCWGTVPQPLSLLRSPNWAQCSRCILSSAKPWGRIAALSSTPVVSSLQLAFVVLVTTWWSCQDIFWTAQSLKITAGIVR